jgi:hypothetical protein
MRGWFYVIRDLFIVEEVSFIFTAAGWSGHHKEYGLCAIDFKES